MNKLIIKNTGGEYTGGILNDQDTLSLIESKISDNETIYDDDIENIYELDSIFHNYGPHIDYDTQIEIIDEEENIIIENPIGECNLNIFTSFNPYPGDYKHFLKNNNELFIFTQQTEKRIEVVIELNDFNDNPSDLSDYFIGLTSMDETINSDEIFNMVLYIPKEKQEEYLSIFLESDFDNNNDECFSDYIEEMFSIHDYDNEGTVLPLKTLTPIYLQKGTLAYKIYSECNVDVEEIAGKGETENFQIILLDNYCETIYNEGEY